jgi:hypothetical protein
MRVSRRSHRRRAVRDFLVDVFFLLFLIGLGIVAGLLFPRSVLIEMGRTGHLVIHLPS